MWMATACQEKNLRREPEIEAFGVGSGLVMPVQGEERWMFGAVEDGRGGRLGC